VTKAQGHLTVSEIAQLAGVRSSSAVSNWRSRAPDFPAVVSRGPTGDLFDRVEVERWLARRRKPRRRAAEEGWTIESIENLEPYDDAIKVALDLLYLTASDPDLIRVGPPNHPDEPAVSKRIRSAVALAESRGDRALSPVTRLGTDPELIERVWAWLRAGLVAPESDETGPTPGVIAALFDRLLTLRGDRRLRSLNQSRTAPWAAELVIELANADHGVVFDPAVGEGGFLLEANKAGGGTAELVGWEHDPDTLRIAQQRLFVHDVEAKLQQADSLGDAGLARVGADAVVCDAPFGLRQNAERWSPTDPRWTFGLPAPIADLGWLELAVHHLRADGRAAVLLPAASLYRGGSEARIRVGLLQAGLVEAIVALPAGTALHTDTPVALWLLRAAADDRSHEVLLIDASEPTEAPRQPPHTAKHDKEMQGLKHRILDVVTAWRSKRRRPKLPPGFAATVDVMKLVEADADLVPSRWATSPASDKEIERAAEAASHDQAQARDSLAARPRLALPLKPGRRAPQRRRIRELIADNRLEIIPGKRIPSTDETAEGTRVLGPWDFRGQNKRFAAETAGFARTEPDDIVIMPAGGAFEAFVDTEGGRLLASPLQAIRITHPAAEGAELLHPRLLAAFVSRPDATAVTSGTAGRPSVKDIAIPLLDDDTARRLAEALDALDTDEQLARDAAAAAATFRRSLLNAANAGWRLTVDSQ
jgi:type I restriction-modification system DNA methylase subunit